MASLVLDPYLLAVPSVSEGEEAARRYVESIVTWSALTDESWLTVLKTDDTETALYGAGCYPAIDGVMALCATLELDEVSPEDVASALARLLQAAQSCEERSGIYDVLLDPMTLTPEVPAVRRRGATEGDGRNAVTVRDATRRLLAMHALVSHCAPTHALNREFASADRFCAGAGVSVEGVAVIIERRPPCVLPPLPDPFALPQTRVMVRDGAEDGLRAIDPAHLWITMATLDAYRAAIRIATLVMDPTLSWAETDRFTLGCEFAAWLPKHNFDRQEQKVRKLLLSCAETLLGRNNTATHALRDGDGATTPQRTRGADKAWRRDIDYEFHLHYWERPGRRFEFGNVVSHNVFTIPYCQ